MAEETIQEGKELVEDSELKEYRNQLCLAEQKAQGDFDKTIISLSGGALGISFAFIKDIVHFDKITFKSLLLLSWLSWGLSILCILVSFYISNLAFRYAIKQVDEGTIYNGKAGGGFSAFVAHLNIFGMMTFITGIILIVIFISKNLGG